MLHRAMHFDWRALHTAYNNFSELERKERIIRITAYQSTLNWYAGNVRALNIAAFRIIRIMLYEVSNMTT